MVPEAWFYAFHSAARHHFASPTHAIPAAMPRASLAQATRTFDAASAGLKVLGTFSMRRHLFEAARMGLLPGTFSTRPLRATSNARECACPNPYHLRRHALVVLWL
jgi:hypothetical protein